MSDTLELIDLEALLGDLVVRCEECEYETANEAKWQATHGKPDCIYLLCDYHKQTLLQLISEHPDCGHKHMQCKICKERFGKNDVKVCPFSSKD